MINIMNESKYTVSAYTDYDLGDTDITDYSTDDPRKAVATFIKMSVKNPGNTDITARTKDAACDLVDWCVNNEEDFMNMMRSTKGFPYKPEYMIDTCKRQAKRRCSGYYGIEEFGDVVDPFTVG